MPVEIKKEDAEKALKGITIPPRPIVLTKLMSEIKKEDCDLRAIVRFISSDVGLSAATLKTVNSPFFGLAGKVSSVQQAVSMLGMRNVTTIATGLLLRGALGGGKPSLERFWDSAEKVANIAAFVASSLPRVSRDDAYTFGLFRDCGIPMLMQKFPNYKETLAIGNGTLDRPMTDVEEERHATNHATIGYLMAKTWYLPDFLCEAILRHHDPGVFAPTDDASAQARTLIAIGALAEQLHDEVMRMRQGHLWETVAPLVMAHLGFDHEEYCDLREAVLEMVH